jgi:hypothetical protein
MIPEACEQTGQACIVEYFFIYQTVALPASRLFYTSLLVDYSNEQLVFVPFLFQRPHCVCTVRRTWNSNAMFNMVDK